MTDIETIRDALMALHDNDDPQLSFVRAKACEVLDRLEGRILVVLPVGWFVEDLSQGGPNGSWRCSLKREGATSVVTATGEGRTLAFAVRDALGAFGHQ